MTDQAQTAPLSGLLLLVALLILALAVTSAGCSLYKSFDEPERATFGLAGLVVALISASAPERAIGKFGAMGAS